MLKLFQNIWLKIIALGLGLLLWFHVATEKIYIYEITLPLKEIVLKDDFTLSNDPPESLTVTVSQKLIHAGDPAQPLQLD